MTDWIFVMKDELANEYDEGRIPEYDSRKGYTAGSLVSYFKASWRSKQDVPVAIRPTRFNEDYWELMGKSSDSLIL